MGRREGDYVIREMLGENSIGGKGEEKEIKRKT